MDEIIQANIFFFITSVGIIVLTVLVSIVLYHVIKLLRSIRSIVDRVDAGSEVIAEDVAQLRAYVTQGSFVSHIMSFVFGKGAKTAAHTRKQTTKEDNL